MSEVTVIGSKAKVELPDALFNAQANVPLMHQVVVAQLAAARQGTHDTKTRSEVSGGGAKPWRQKGTGRARQGSRRAPQWTGGGVVHGPTPRNYAQRTPKKMIAAALFGALSDRARDGRIHVIEQVVTGENPSTKEALKSLATINSAKLLVVLSRDEDVAWLSLRNVPSVQVIVVDQLNAYDVLLCDDVVFTKEALSIFVARQPVSSAQIVEPAATETKAAPAKVVIEEPKAETVEELVAKTEPTAKTRAGDPSDYGEGSYRGDNPPEGFDVKGNESSMKFHLPTSPWYGRTTPQVWFNSAEAAEAAGFVNAQGSQGADEKETK